MHADPTAPGVRTTGVHHSWDSLSGDIHSRDIHVFGLVHRPGLVSLPSSPPLRGRRLSLIDILARAELDASAEVLVAHSVDQRHRALPLHDSLAVPGARVLWSRQRPARLVVPRWIDASEHFVVVGLQALTFADFLRAPQLHERSEG